MAPPLVEWILLLQTGAPILWGYISGRLKRHKIGLPLAFIPYILFLTQALAFITSGFANIMVVFQFTLILSVGYSASAIVGYYFGYFGFRHKPRSKKDNS